MHTRVTRLTLLSIMGVAVSASAKQASRLVTAEMRGQAVRQAASQDWARGWRDQYVKAAEPWLALSDEDLWLRVPSQEVPRAIYLAAGILYEGKPDACPNCRKPIGYEGRTDFWKQDWKVVCPRCQEAFPRNDFGAFYRTALDERGCFRRNRGDRSLLVNADHPDPNDPQHGLWIDDGYGMQDAQGNVHHAVAYCAAAYWNCLIDGAQNLAWAYAMTDDRRYAHKAAVLLDRIADVYPEMDYYPLGKLGFQHSHGGTLHGRIRGCIWETGTGEALARAYDTIHDGIQDDTELVAFSTARSARHGLGDKSSVAAICAHIEDHLLLEVLQSIKDARVAGNTGMNHTCLALVAIALDRPTVTEEWLDWLFDPAFPVTDPKRRSSHDPVPWVMVQGLDRDGMGGECGGYGLIWSRSMLKLAEILAAYPAYTRHDLLREYPTLRQCVMVEARLNVLDAVMPNLGDTGACGYWGRVGSAEHFVRGWRLFRDPEMAAWAWRRAGGKPEALRLRPESAFEAEPDALAALSAAGSGPQEPRFAPDFLSRYGQGVLQTGTPQTGRAATLHFGFDKGHSHHDSLTLGLFAHQVDLLPDHGYPAFTGSYPQRIAWTSNTSSHNTLMVDDRRSGLSPGGRLEVFADLGPLQVMQAAAPQAYGPPVEAYRRTLLLVAVSDSEGYLLDIFRARGGRRHRLVVCGGAAQATAAGVVLAPQQGGTFAGPTVPFEALPGPGETTGNTSGFSYLTEVSRSPGPVATPYTVDWRIEDARGRIAQGAAPHLRLHALTACDEVALASGQPPQNHKGNPPSLRYLVQSRFGEALRSQYVSLLEPYDREPFVVSVHPLPVETDAAPDTVAAVAVDLADGRRDVLIVCEQPSPVRLADGTEMIGLVGLVRQRGGAVESLRLVGGTLLRAGEAEVRAPMGAWTGTVTAVDISRPADHGLTLDPPLPETQDLIDRPVHFITALPYDTTYRIRAVAGPRVSTGDQALVSGFRDPQDFAAGYTLQVNPGDGYVVHALAGWDR